MVIQVVHFALSLSVILALWNMGYNDTSSKILITAFISGNFVFVYYYKQLFKIKIKEVINREVELQTSLIENHQKTLDELKEANWEKLNAKQSELTIYKQRCDQLLEDNNKLQKTITKINSYYYQIVDNLGATDDSNDFEIS